MTEFDRKLEAVLRRALPGFESVLECRRLSGGASQETYRLEILQGGEKRLLAMRRAAGGEEQPHVDLEDPTDSARPGLETEARLFRVAGAAGVPEPEIYHVLAPEDQLGSGFIMEWLSGETLGARINKLPELAEIRPRLAFECGQILARIHDIDPVKTGLSEHLARLSTREVVLKMWHEYKAFETPQPMIDYTARWLLDHLPEADDQRLTHSDFRNGNLMIGPEGVVAVLDWELAYIGDPVRDLGWICTNSWRFGRPDLPVGGFGTREDLLAGYEAESGRRVDLEHVRFWEVFGSYWWAVTTLRMANLWRHGPDPTVERPAIARRSSEAQTDCVNLIISGPVELVEPVAAATTLDMPSCVELLTSVRDFLRKDVREEVTGRTNFMALVASNSLDIALREQTLGPPHLTNEHARLKALLGSDGDLTELRWRLVRQLRDESQPFDCPGLAEHLRLTVVNQLAIDQPKYSGLKAALSYVRSKK